MPDTAHRLRDAAEAGLLAVGTGLAISRDAHENQAGVGPRQILGTEAPAFHGAGAKVLDEDVRLQRQLSGQVLALRLTQVQRDASLVPGVDRPEEVAVAKAFLRPVTQWVT